MQTSHSSVSLPVTHAPRSLNWRCGDIDMGNGMDGMIKEGHLADWSRQGLDVSIAYDQVNIIVTSSLHALRALRSMVALLTQETTTLLQNGCCSEGALKQIDLLLGQLDAIVTEAALGEVNLLRCQMGCLNIPYLITEITDADEHHSFATMGMSNSAVREPIPELGDLLVGIYVLTTDTDKSVCWLNSPSFWVNAVGGIGSEHFTTGFRNEVETFHERLEHFDQLLESQEQQLSQYIKMVGEVVTDLMVES